MSELTERGPPSGVDLMSGNCRQNIGQSDWEGGIGLGHARSLDLGLRLGARMYTREADSVFLIDDGTGAVDWISCSEGNDTSVWG